ncbi:hypothetical protein GLAREA_09380 [Glarea lozoyensis ATCC 20868]|uniref:Uncharacterized protein n=1 Tax=Glarea lozoyensis (strain ATCC 20868 / MF5171) TaxID=1116229 RepID=S3CRG5_GLAL2|nr:uncharacterized protein GLAREA_09380 [Glarea lozoyensis ATCC 20868]EPE28260.1 hypothetical protein GLAREA_09380 [Glarea lozoyensis ATCC 20868]
MFPSEANRFEEEFRGYIFDGQLFCHIEERKFWKPFSSNEGIERNDMIVEGSTLSDEMRWNTEEERIIDANMVL